MTFTLDQDDLRVVRDALESHVRSFPADLTSAALLLRVREALPGTVPESQPWGGSRGPIVPPVPKGTEWPEMRPAPDGP